MLAILFTSLILAYNARAEPNYHLVGWLNAAVPGTGELLLGDPALAAAQAAAETGTFFWGYSMSAHAPLTIDGVPEIVPGPSPTNVDLSRPLYGDMLQEFGMKYHMVNVYNAYRKAGAPGVDTATTLALFESPFNKEFLTDPWVWGGLAVSAAAIGIKYYVTEKKGVAPLSSLTPQSNALYGLTYGLVFPIGSGAPEEMFYRGFVQNELYQLVSSPYFSIPLSTLAYTFSHASGDRPTAAITGIYLGYLAHQYKGHLGPGIAYHFWVDVMTGLLAIALLQRAEYQSINSPPIAFQFNL